MKIRTIVFYPLFMLVVSACGFKVGTKSANSNVAAPKTYSNVKASIETSEGTIHVKLYDETPLHRDNFANLVENGFYNGLIFHRVIRGFMIQSGDPNSKNPVPDAKYGNGGPDYTVAAEINPKFFHKKGALSAARLGDNQNPKKESSGSQFYIVQGRVYDLQEILDLENKKQVKNPNFKFSEEAIAAYTTIGGAPHLDGDYTVFGEVTEGLDVVDLIGNCVTKAGDRPEKDVLINKIVLQK